MSQYRRFASLFYLATLFAFFAASNSQAALVLQYFERGYAPNVQPLVVTNSGGTTTFLNNQAGPPTTPAIAVSLNLPTMNITNVNAYMNFSNFASVGGTFSVASLDVQSFEGKISFTSNADGTGTNFLTVTFNQAVFTAVDGGSTANVQASSTYRTAAAAPAPGHAFVSFTSDVMSFLSGNEDISLSINNISPAAAIDGNTIAGFVANSSGTFSAQVPAPTSEPSTFISAAIAAGAFLGVRRLNRRRSP